MASEIEVVKGGGKDLEHLLARFYDENQDMMAHQQHDVAKKDLGYLLALLDRDGDCLLLV